MREILFRGKQIDDGEWVYGNLLNKIDLNKPIPIFWTSLIHDGALTAIEVIPETVGQFTGLTDKNGKKIFEGDICVSTLGYIFKVAYDSENARFIGFDIENNSIIYPGREPKAEVIGSIHDNPELLKGGQQ